VSGSPLYLSEAAQTVYFSSGLMQGNATVAFVNDATHFTVIGDSPSGGAIKGTGTATLWFQGQVIRYGVYD
jgi:hypothetical protein